MTSSLPESRTYLKVGSWWWAYRSHLGGYMRRWVVQTPIGTLRLHHISAIDDDEDLHDHPWWFASMILAGSYRHVVRRANERASREITRRPGSVSVLSATDAHRIVEVSDGGVWTLVLSGPRVRRWGYTTATGWVAWRDYHGLR